MEGDAQLTPTIKEFVSSEVFCEHVSWVIVHLYKVKADFALLHYFSDVVEVDVHVFGALLCHSISGIEDRFLIISA